MKLAPLCLLCKEACDVMVPMLSTFYLAMNGESSKLKADKSVFTIADGIVQHMLVNHLFVGDKFKDIVGEEDCRVNISKRPFTVADLAVPDEFCDAIEGTLASIDRLGARIDADSFKHVSVFIDPIDGTREFASGLGEQCSICIGFSDPSGRPLAGLVFRPLTPRPTWAAGAASENFIASELDMATTPNPTGLLTSNGGISDFVVNLIRGLQYTRVPSGGAGNKMLMLLENKGGAYIQDRGVSRWDTAGAQAVLEAHGGILSKLTTFVERKELSSYTYLKTSTNLDFESGVPNLSPYNVVDKSLVKKDSAPVKATDVSSVLPYANLCGLLALNRDTLKELDKIHAVISSVKQVTPPSYD